MSYLSRTKFSVFILSFVLALSGFLQLQPLKAQAKGSRIQDSTNGVSLTSIPMVQSASTGLISGELSYPSERIPALTIFATRIDNGKSTYYSIETGEDQSSYSIRVDPGVYYLVAYFGDMAGGYTKFVKCGMSVNCQDHSLVPVMAAAGETITGVDIQDWYAPSGTFPSQPDRGSTNELTAACVTFHTIKPGENLFRIGLMYGMTWTPIARANNIENPNHIYAGQVLCIPQSAPSKTWKSTTLDIPTFEIVSVVKNEQVTIKTNNFPLETDFVVTMGEISTQGIDGVVVARTNSGQGGSFTTTYPIPAKLQGKYQIAIRLQSSTGYYSYNWFYNNSTE